MPQNKNPIQEIIEQQRSQSPASELTAQQIAQKVGNLARAEGVRANTDKISQGMKRVYEDPNRREQQKIAMQNRDNSSHKFAAEKRSQDPTWKAKQKQGVEKVNQDPEYRKHNRQCYLKAKESQEYWDAYYAGIKKRDSDPEYHKRRIAASNAKLAIKISTPDGVFDSISDAARHYGLTSEGMRHRVNSSKYPDYKKIEN